MIKINLFGKKRNGETCLHYAVRGGHLNTAKILLSMGIDFSISGKNGTCLKVAEHEGHFHLIEFLRSILFLFFSCTVISEFNMIENNRMGN